MTARKRLAEFKGYRDDVIHGQKVRVKVFSSITEPTLDIDKAVQHVMEGTPEEVSVLRHQFNKYLLDKRTYDSIELEEDEVNEYDYNFSRPQPDLVISKIREEESPNEIDEEIPMDKHELPMEVDEYFGRFNGHNN